MNNFNKYVLKIYIKYIIIVQALITIVTMFSSALSHLQGMQKFGITLPQLVKLEIITIPMGINSALPITIVVASIVTVLLLMRTHELLAYISLGGRIIGFISPFIIASVITALFMFIFDSYLYPNVRATQQRYIAENIKKQKYTDQRSLVHIWTMTEAPSLLYIDYLDALTGNIWNVTEYELDDNFQVSRVKSTNHIQHTDTGWQYNDIKIVDLSALPPKISYVKSEIVNNSMFDDFISISGKNPRLLSLQELSQISTVMKARGLSTVSYDMLLYSKYANALSVIVLSILVIPIGITFSRKYSIIKNAMTAFAFGIAFWATTSAMYSLGNSGVIPPLTANFLPHVLFLIIGGIILVKREHAQ